MIERISRQVDLESGVVPRQSRPEDDAEGTTREVQASRRRSVERSEENVMRELVERIAQEVDAEGRGGASDLCPLSSVGRAPPCKEGVDGSSPSEGL